MAGIVNPFSVIGRRRSRSTRRSSHRGSVVFYLLALAVVPSIGLPVFAGIFAKDRLEDSRAASRIGRTMTLAVELDDLRQSIADESTSSALEFYGQLYDLTLEDLANIIGENLTGPLETARARTDRAFASLQLDTVTQPSITALRRQLVDARTIVDDGLSTVPLAASSGYVQYETFAALGNTVDGVVQSIIARVVTGYYGAASSELLTSVAQLQRVTLTVDAANDRGVLLQGLFSALTDADRAQMIAEMRVADANWKRLSGSLAPGLSSGVGEFWRSVRAEPDVKGFDAYIGTVVRPGNVQAPSQLSPETKEGARTAIVLAHLLSDLIQRSSAEGVAVARADEVSAEQRAKLAVGTTIALMLVTAGLLVLIGGSLRRRLGGLATAAERFSAGHFDEMQVHGPREIAVASSALNDAVASFRRVAVQAERLSAGDLDAPELQHPAPGALGTAVHTSVKRILVAVREREKLQEALAHQAAHDDLTALPNRAETERLLAKALGRARRSDARVGVLFVDLDHFKQCNDTLGHAAGDHVLRAAAGRMMTVVRSGDTVCRLGGDEFVVVVEPVVDDGDVVEVAERIAAVLSEPVAYRDTMIVTGGTVGVAISDDDSDADSLLSEADSAMYRAKATARGSVEIYNEALRADMHREAEFRVAMGDALTNGELELHYQPVLDVATGDLTGFEALARWRRPGHGLVPPDDFIPLAERSGLIIAIGRWALATATTQLVAWSTDPAYARLQIAVNLSGRHIADPGVVGDVHTALAASGLEPGRLVIEITESIAIDNPTTIQHLLDLGDLGVLIALDDFGTGYTSIGQLLHLPVHILKIDRSLISGTNEDGTPALDQSARIIDLIVEVAHSLGLGVIAEGVEDNAQLARLADAGCESAQGYLFSRPLPGDQLTNWVTAHNGRNAQDTVPSYH
jgi:diguanylate cyclase (GGDEF)-like protein